MFDKTDEEIREHSHGFDAGIYAEAYGCLDVQGKLADRSDAYVDGFVRGWVFAASDEELYSDDEIRDYWLAFGMPDMGF